MKKFSICLVLVLSVLSSIYASEVIFENRKAKLNLSDSVKFTADIWKTEENLFKLEVRYPRFDCNNISIGKMNAGSFSSVWITAFKTAGEKFDIYMAKEGFGFTLNSKVNTSLFILDLPSKETDTFKENWKTSSFYGKTVLLAFETDILSYKAGFSKNSGFIGNLKLDLDIENFHFKRIFSNSNETELSVSFTAPLECLISYNYFVSEKAVYGGTSQYKRAVFCEYFSFEDFSLNIESEVEIQQDTGTFYSTEYSLSWKNFEISTVFPRTEGLRKKLSNTKFKFTDQVICFELSKEPSVELNLNFGFLQLIVSSEIHDIVTWKFRF